MKVSQEAREAAADLYQRTLSFEKSTPRMVKGIREGRMDSILVVQAFAAFEQSIRDKALEEAAGIAEARIAECDRFAKTHFDYTARYHNECREMEARHIATAIRQMKGEG